MRRKGMAASCRSSLTTGAVLASFNAGHHTKGGFEVDGYGKRVLVVDDDDDVRAIMTTILSEAGYNIYEACDGLDAVEALKKRRYDVLITDYHMPKMDGLELLDLVQAMWPQLPVILASSDSLLRGAGESLLAPAYALLDKPFERADLLGLIRSAVCGLPKTARQSVRPMAAPPSYQAVA
ncbi:MAG TPA: response regulator [Nitrospira sp.]|nr:response regulator [Nitrospira sp.]